MLVLERDYIDLVSKRNSSNQVVGLHCIKNGVQIRYVLYERGNKNMLFSLLGDLEGKATAFEFCDRYYWLLTPKRNDRLLLFRRDENDNDFDISPDAVDLAVMEQLATI